MAGKIESFHSKNEKGDVSGYVVGDAGSKKGLIVIHEWWGLNEQIKAMGEEMAKQANLLVLVIDMYRGQLADDRETAGHLMQGLDWKGAVLDISAGAQFLKSKGCAKIGVTGFCMGGALSFASACLCADVISAAAPFYGIPSADLCDLTTIKTPVQCHFGSQDEVVGFSSKKDYDPLCKKLQAAGVPLELHEYEAGHAFCNPLNKIGPNYKPDLAELALGRMYDFMNKHLA